MTEPRPKKLTEEMAMKAARAVVEDLIRDGLIDDDHDGHARDIAKHGRLYQDGYRLAKELDKWCYWDCDLATAEILDGFSSHADAEVKLAEKEWAERNDIKPSLPVGAHVTIRSGETGIIDGIYQYGAAKFLVKIDDDPNAITMNSRRIVNFEDVTAKDL